MPIPKPKFKTGDVIRLTSDPKARLTDEYHAAIRDVPFVVQSNEKIKRLDGVPLRWYGKELMESMFTPEGFELDVFLTETRKACSK